MTPHVEVVHASQGNVARLGTEVIDRIVKFAEKYHPEANSDVLTQNVLFGLYQQPPVHQVVLAAITGARVWGHLYATIEYHFGSPQLTIVQLELDKDEREGRQDVIVEGLGILDRICEAAGITRQIVYARNKKVARIFEQLGYNDTGRVLMRRDL